MNHSRAKAVLTSLLISYILTAVLLTLLAVLLYRFRLGEKQVSIGVNTVYIITCLIGGLAAVKIIRQRRFLWGLLTGLIYFLILLAVSYILQKGISGDTASVLKTLAMCAGGGMAGGMLS